MAVLEKSKCKIVMANILFQVFRENCNDFPISFDDFGAQVTDKLYEQFKFLEGNALSFGAKKHKVFDKYCEVVSQPEQSVLEMIEPIALENDDKVKSTDEEIIEDIQSGAIESPDEVIVQEALV